MKFLQYKKSYFWTASKAALFYFPSPTEGMDVPYDVTWETSNRNDRGREIGVSEDDNFVTTVLVLTAEFPVSTRWIVVIFPITSAVL